MAGMGGKLTLSFRHSARNIVEFQLGAGLVVRSAVVLFIVALLATFATRGSAAAPAPQVFLHQMAPATPDDCAAPVQSSSTFDLDHSEALLFESVDALVADRLNR